MNIQIFEYKFDEVRTAEDRHGNIWWVAQDICNILGLENVSKAISTLEDDEISNLTNSKVRNQNRPLKIINEPGLYSLIFKSRKPEAKEFKRWVTHEVLPSIRKTGNYSMIGNKKRSISKMASDFEAFKRVATAAGLKGNNAIISANESMIEHYGENPLELIGLELEPEKDLLEE